MKKLLFIVLLLTMLTTFAQDKKLWAKSVINKKAPELVVHKWISDKPEINNKFVLIDFWATWCKPCRKLIPELNSFSKEFREKLVVIGISDETKSRVKKFKSPKINYYSAVDPKKTMKDELQVQGIPHCILIDPNGIVRWEGYPLLTGFELTSEVIQEVMDEFSRKNTDLE